MRRVLWLTLLALGTCSAARHGGRDLMQAPAATPAPTPGPWVDPSLLQECGNLLANSLTPPPKAVVAAVFQSTGLENYTCIDGRWRVLGSRKDLYYGDTGEFGGYMFTEASDSNNSRYILTDPTNTTVWGDAVKDNQVTYNVKSIDPEVNRPMWRRPLLRVSGVAEHTVLVIKTNVVEGMPPNGGDCSSEGDQVQVPMNSTYTFYACKSPIAVPHDTQRKCDPSAALQGKTDEAEFWKPWEVPANGTAKYKCTGGKAVLDSTGCTMGSNGTCYDMDGFFVVDFQNSTGQWNAGAGYWMDPSQAQLQTGPAFGAKLEWALYPVAKVRLEQHCEYVLRWNTAGGMPPSCTGVAEGTLVPVDYTATYSCLQCQP